MIPMAPEQRIALRDVLAGINPAAPELVQDAVADTYASRWTTGKQAETAQRRAAEAVTPIARRLLDAETELATLREIVARLVVGNDHGDDASLSDLAHELKTRGVDLCHEYATAADLIRARGQEAAR